jgi:ATP-dependent Clp protease ATP-binding subunit ClpC
LSASTWIGSPPGYVGHDEGGQLTERIRRQPYSVVLFDEIEKAHPDVANLLLQILEDGMLTDAYGNKVDFKNTLVIMTSNIGSKIVLSGGRMGFGEASEEQSFESMQQEILGELRRTFSPEFINRVDELIVYRPLGNQELSAIVDILLNEINMTLGERGLTVKLSEEAKEWLLDRAAIDPTTGARPLRRVIQRHIQDSVSEVLIARSGALVEEIEVSVVGDELRFEERMREPVGEET